MADGRCTDRLLPGALAPGDLGFLNKDPKSKPATQEGNNMTPKDAAQHLGISQRMLRHYEKAGLMEIGRTANGYRHYSPADLRRAARIRDFIATGFSTREVYAMRACLSDDGSGPCTGGVAKLTEKRDHIDRLIADLQGRRAAVQARLSELEQELSAQTPAKDLQPA